MTDVDPTLPRERLKRMSLLLDTLAAESYTLRTQGRVDPALVRQSQAWSMEIGNMTAQIRNLLTVDHPPFQEGQQ